MPIDAKPFTRWKNKILGRDYELSLVFTDNKLSHYLNKTYRKKNKPADVLSFPLSDQSGEIFIDLVTARKEMGKFGMPFKKFVAYLFIHGLLHLKGMKHGHTMEQAEKKILHGSSNYNRHRHRHF